MNMLGMWNDADFTRHLGVYLGVSPADYQLIQPASLDFRLGSSIKRETTTHNIGDCDPYVPDSDNWEEEHVPEGQGFRLNPGEFVLASTKEYFTVSPSIAVQVGGKSSLARRGLLVHATAGFIDPGFVGEITLELFNLSRRPLRLYSGMPIGTLCAWWLTGPSKGYNGKYNGQRGATTSRYHHNRRVSA